MESSRRDLPNYVAEHITTEIPTTPCFIFALKTGKNFLNQVFRFNELESAIYGWKHFEKLC